MSEEFEPTGEYDTGPVRYDWALWTNGKVHLARKGEDYQCVSKSFEPQPHIYARNHPALNLKAVTRVYEWDDSVMFQFYSADQPRPKLPERAVVQAQKLAAENPDAQLCRVCHLPFAELEYNHRSFGEHVLFGKNEDREDVILSLHDKTRTLYPTLSFPYTPDNPYTPKES